MTITPTARVTDVAELDGMRVFVYWNLHRHLWSLRAAEGPHYGRIVGHASSVRLRGATGVVNEKQRQRVIRTRNKNVHAGILGRVDGLEPRNWTGVRITYNPYDYATFVYADDTERVYTGSEWAALVVDETGDRRRGLVAVPA